MTLDKIPHYVLRTTFTNSFKETKKRSRLAWKSNIVEPFLAFFFYSPDVQTSGKMVDGENRPLVSDGVGSGACPSDATV